MPRPNPPQAPSLDTLKPRDRTLVAVEIAVVTPLFGGGAVAKEPDPVAPVRGGAVRGHLRFWWRACNAHHYAEAKELFKAEEAIWGSARVEDATESGPGAIEVEVEIRNPGEPRPCAVWNRRIEWTDNWPGYALFPFQGKTNDPTEPPATALVGVVFQLRLSGAAHVPAERTDALRQAATSALWAWITFGGVGARTRRGCGALYCADPRFHPDGANVRGWLQDTARMYLADPAESGDRLPVPTLHGAVIALGANNNVTPVQAWRNAVEVYQHFRQQKAGGNRFGKSLWPEANSIRAIHHSQEQHLAFPRAELGLPIVFQFQDTGAKRRNDPKQATLEVAQNGATRMASPIIVKPLMTAPQTGVAMALRLNAPLLTDLGVPLRLQGGVDAPVANPAHLAPPAGQGQAPPLFGAANARNGFLRFLQRDRGWEQPFEIGRRGGRP